MKKATLIQTILLILALGIFLTFVILISKLIYENVRAKADYDMNELDQMVSFRLSKMNNEVYEVSKPETVDIFTENYQHVIDDKINILLSVAYSFEHPFMILNPYGTSTSALNVYFSEAGNISYTVHVDGMTDYQATASTQQVGKNYGFSLIGLIPGYKNQVTMTLTTSDGSTKTKKFHINLTNLKSQGEVTTELEVESGDSITSISSGLYAVLGHDKSYNSNVYLYDNEGILRGELMLDSYRADRIIFKDNHMIYSAADDMLIEVDGLGHIVQFYKLKDYDMHHDYVYDESDHSLLILASEKNTETIEDRIIRLNLTSGEVQEVVDMKDLFEDVYQRATVPEKNSYGGTELDWIHLNSIDLVDHDTIVVSARETSSIIKLSNINTQATVDYVIADDSIVGGTDSSSYNLTKIGEFTSNAGQHSVLYETDDSLEEGCYYLSLYNNNYGNSPTLPGFDFSAYPGVGSYSEGEASYYYKYLINEQEQTYELVDTIALDYSSIVSNVQKNNSNIITSSGMSHLYAEYDQDGDLIRKFHYASKKFAYRVFKYNFINVWFVEL